MAMGIAQQFVGSLTGNIEQACIYIADNGSSPTTGASSSAATGKLGMLKSALSLNAPTPSIAGGPNSKCFNVHFNPSQLQIYASTFPVKKVSVEGQNPAQNSAGKARLTLSTTLYFDEMNVYDSFMWEKFTGGLTAQGAKNIASAVMSAKGKVWSVQDEVEGLISALRNETTRNVKFVWADFVFIGQLKDITANYTMFSTSGRPVRANVQLRIRQERDDTLLASWYSDFDKAFGGGQSNLLGAAQKAGNLLNLPL